MGLTEKDKSRYTSILKKFSKVKILAIGDLILDEFIWGSVSRISPEAPVPVVKVERESFMPGGNLNVANNIVSLGASVYPCGVIGRDLYGRMLVRLMRKRGIEVGGIVYAESRPTTLKTRVIAHSQQVVRFDREDSGDIKAKTVKKMLEFAEGVIQDVDCILIEDYGKGVIVPSLLKKLIALAKQHDKIILVDPKEEHLSHYKGATSMTPNHHEARSALGVKGKSMDVNEIGKHLMRKLDLKSLLITMGEQGMMLFEKNGATTHIPTTAKEVYDVSGAGDTVIAVFAMALGAGASLQDAAVLANMSGGLVVAKVGTATITPSELKNAILQS